MADKMLAYDVAAGYKRDLEERAQVESLEALQATRRTLIEQAAKLKALHGPFGLFDDLRKQRLELCKVQAREAMTQQGAKITEAAVEQAAYADAEYRKMLDDAVQAKVQWVMQETKITEVEERIRSRELELVAYAAEARLGR